MVIHIDPAPDSTVRTGPLNVNVTFSEAVLGVDESDLELSGAAAIAATVGTPINQEDNTWLFPITGLVDGSLHLSLAPDAGDIEDATGKILDNEVWDYTAATFEMEDFETGDFSNFPWGRFGSADWTITSDEQHNGVYSAQAGSIGHRQSTWLVLNGAPDIDSQPSSRDQNAEHFARGS